MRRYFPIAIIGAVLLLAIGGGLLLLKWKQQQQPSETSPIPPIAETTPAVSETPPTLVTPIKGETPGVTAKSGGALAPESLHLRGKGNAPVTLEEYGDFQCAPCGRLYPVLKTLEQDYGDRLRVIFRHMPLRKHEHAPLAARVAEAAGLQGQFWEMHDMLYENSLRWSKGIDTVGPEVSPSRRMQSNLLAMDVEVRDVFYRYAEILKLDVDRFKQDLDSEPVRARVDADRSRGVALGIDRTPTVYLNGHHLAYTALTAEGLHAAMEATLAGKPIEEAASPTPGGTSPVATAQTAK